MRSELIQTMIGQQGMRNLVYEMKEVIDQPQSLDIWVVYCTEKELDQCYSLSSLLWDIKFDPSKVVKNYEIEHSTFYHMLQQENGKMHLAIIIEKVCELLKIIADIGALFGSLRIENIIIKLDLRKQKIL